MSGTDKSTLEISVITTGLNGNGGAPAQLNKLGEAAGKAEPKVAGLLATIEKLMKQQQGATAVALQYTQAIQGSNASLGGGSANAGSLATATRRLAEAMITLSSSMTTVQAKTTSSQQALTSYIGTMKDGQAAARGFAGSLGALWTTYGNAIPLAAGLAIGASMKGIVSVGAEVEHTLEGIRVRGQESLTSIGAMRDTIMELGKGVYGPKEVSKALETMILAGLNAKEAMAGVRDALNLATVGGTTIEKSAEVLVQVGTALDYDANAYGRIADVISMTAAASMSSVESVSESFKAGSVVGKMYGATIEDIGAEFAMLSNLGIKGSAAGTAVKNFYSYLSSGADKVTRTLKDMGMTINDLKDAQGNFKGIEEVMGSLSDGLDKLTESQQKLAIANLSNERGAKVLVEGLSLVRKATGETTNALSDLVKKVDESFGYAAVGAAAMALTIESQFKSVKNTLQTQFLAAFQDIQPQLSVVASSLKDAFNSPEFAKGIQGIALTLADLAVALAENIGLLKTVFELFLAWKAVGFVAGMIIGIAESLLTLKTAMEASRIAALALQASLGILVIALTAAAAAWVWYHNKKDEVNADYKANIAYMDDFTGKLNEEAVRLEKQLELMQKGKTAREAETQAIRDQQLALVQLAGEKAAEGQRQKYSEALGRLTPAEQRAYDQAKAGNKSATNIPAVAQAIKEEQAWAKAIADTNVKRDEAVKAQERVVVASRKIADLAASQSKTAQTNPNAGTGVLTPKTPKGRAGPDLENKENEEFARRMEQMTTSLTQAKETAEGYRQLGSEYNKLTEGGKLLIKYKYELDIAQKMELNSVNALHIAHLKMLITGAERLEFEQKLAKFQQDKFASGEALQRDTDNRIRGIETEAAGIQRKADAYGQLKGATDLDIAASLEQQKNLLIESGITGQVINDLNREIAARKALSEAKGNLAVVKNNADALDEMNKALDPSKAFQFGDGFEKAFGKIGKAIDGATKAYDAYGKKMKDTQKSASKLNDITDLKSYVNARNALNYKSMKDEMDMYGDMASAAKGFFKEKTLAYKLLDATEKGFRIASMALAFMEMESKMAYIAAVTAAKGTAAATEASIDTTLTGESLANSAAQAEGSLTAGVAKAFEQLGVYGFVGAAAIIAFLASMGVSGGGGGATMPSISEQRQKTQGTGTVLGSEDSKSESIKNSLATLADNSDITLPYTSKMLMALKNIESGIGGMANFVARSTGLRGTSADQSALGVGSSKSALGFGSSSTELTDSGILFGTQSVGDAMNRGVNASSYADLHKESSSWWGLSHSSSDTEQLGALNPALSKQITMTINDMVKGVTSAAEALGKSAPEVSSQLQMMSLNIGRISLKGLSGDDLVKELEAAFSQLGDRMAESIFGNLQDFQKVGEGLLETATRVATGVEVAKVALSQLGMTAVGIGEVVNKQGDVGAEIVRKTLTNQERNTQLIISWQGWYNTVAYGALNGIGEIIDTMDGSASDLIETYKQLVDVRSQMKAAGLGENLNRDWVTGAGGLDKLSSGMGDFISGMFSDAEKLQMQTNSMTESFGKLGFKLPATSQAFRELVQAVAAQGNDDLAGKLIVLSGGFNDLQSAMKDAADAAKEAADKADEDAKAAREKLLADAHDNLSAAYDKEKQSLADTQSKFEEFAKSLRAFRDGLMTGASSPGTPGQKYAAAASQYATTAALAKSGDKDAIAKFQDIANTFLQLSRDYNASGDAYTQDFNRVMTESGMLADYADQQVDVATASLDALNKQVAGLVDVNKSVLSVQVAIMQLYDAMVINKDTTKYDAMSSSLMQQYAGQSDPGSISMYSSMMANGASYQQVADAITKAYPMDGSHANGLGYVPFDGYRAELHEGEAVLTASENKQYQMGLGNKSDNGALVNELKGLREEVKQLKEEQRQQTQALIGSNYDAQSDAACKVVDGVSEALSQSARTDRVKPSLN